MRNGLCMWICAISVFGDETIYFLVLMAVYFGFCVFLMWSRFSWSNFSVQFIQKLNITRVFATFYTTVKLFFLHWTCWLKGEQKLLRLFIDLFCSCCFFLSVENSLPVNNVIKFQWEKTSRIVQYWCKLFLVFWLLTLHDWYLKTLRIQKPLQKQLLHAQELFHNKQSVKIGQNTTKCFYY